MKPTMKKWLTGLLSVALLAGNLPVYAVNTAYAAEEDGFFTDEAESFEGSLEEPEENPDGGQSEDSFASVSEFTGFTSGEAEEDFSGEEDFVAPDSQDGFEGEADPTTLLESDMQDEGGYLQNLTLYTSQSGVSTVALKRSADLDAEFGGKVYVAEYGSNMDSASFWITADLAGNAPDGSAIQLETTGLDGQKQNLELSTSAYKDGTRYNVSASVFSSGGNGSKRALYTITAGTEGDKQVYQILVERRLDLSDLKAYLPDDKDLAKNILPKFDTTGTTRDYETTVVVSTASLQVVPKAFSSNWYQLAISSENVTTGEVKEVPFSSTDTAVSVPLADTGDTKVTLSMSEANTYADPALAEKTYTSTGTYTILVHKSTSDKVSFQVTPEDAVISVYDKDGERLTPSADSLMIYENILQGEAYTWNISKYGYISKQGSFTGGEVSDITAELVKQDATQPEITDNDWINFRNSDTNNGITGSSTPTSADSTLLKWNTRIGVGWEAAITPPLILGGAVYVASGQFIYKLDKNTGEILQTSEQLSGNMQYAMIPLTYAEGMLFAQIGGGQIQAVSATSLKSLWISESLGGQTLSPITYKDGYIYTGTWNSETTAGSYFCLSVTDEDPFTGTEIKHCTWKYNHKGGFYWAGSYASSDYLVFGSDDGSSEGTDTNSAILYSVNTHTGLLLDKMTSHGDIRSTIVYNNGYVYFTTKGGYLYRVQMNADGTFGSTSSYNLGGMATASPVVYKGRIYVGVCGNGGQFNSDGGHHFAVLNETASGISLAYNVSIPGYPQAAPLLSTAYENQDYNGDGQADGRVYLYFTYNAKPGGIYMLSDEPGQTSGTAVELFRPASDQQEYCISTICADREGTLYYKNDSNYLMALETNGAYLNSVTATADTGKVTWPSAFRKDTLKYNLTVAENASKVTFALKAPEGCTITVNGQAYAGSFVADVSSGSTDIKVTISGQEKSREYTFHISQDISTPVLANMTLSTSNTYSNTANRISLSPEFSSVTTSYRAIYKESREFLNIFAEPADSSASVTAVGIRGTSKVTVLGKVTGSGASHRIAMYFDKTNPQAEAEVKVTVTTKSGKTTDYTIVVQRTDTTSPTPTVTPVPATPTPVPQDPTPTEVPEVFGPWTTVSAATVFAPETQKRTSNKGKTETRTVGSKLTPTIKVTASSIKLKVKQSTTKVKVSGLANGDSIKSWTTSNKKIVTVTRKGTIKGLKAGKAKVTITLASGKKQVINVTVQKTAVKTTKITGIASKATLKKGKKLTLKPVVAPITSLQKVTYTTSNKKVATVTAKGVITAKKKGTATITVKSGSKSKKIKIKVK